jgi:hypothetical protein
MANKDRLAYYGMGVYREGKYKCNKNRKIYDAWREMLKRCYSEKYHKRQPSYIGCTVCEEWLDFQTFAEWFNDNYYELENEKVALDKDFLIKGNKVYSPETCLFVPMSINALLILHDAKRGQSPLGVHYRKDRNKYSSSCRIDGSKIHLGLFNTPEQASNVYQEFKAKVINITIGRYDNIIPINVSAKLYQSWNDNYNTISNNIGA